MSPCGTCRWWTGPKYLAESIDIKEHYSHDKGECHGGVPQPGDKVEVRWPMTRRTDGCPGWREME